MDSKLQEAIEFMRGYLDDNHTTRAAHIRTILAELTRLQAEQATRDAARAAGKEVNP